MTVIGRQDATRYRFQRSDMKGRCDEATHVVTGLTVGAFTFSAGRGTELGAEASIGGAGAGAKSSSSSELLNTDGDLASCALASGADLEPPVGCGSLLRVEMVPIEGHDPLAGQRVAAGTGSDKDGGDPSSSSPEAADLQRKVKTTKLIYLSGYLGAVGFGLTSTVGFALISKAEDDLTASRSDLSLRDAALSKYRTGKILGWGGVGAAGAAAVVGLVALGAHNKAQSKLKQLSFIGGPQRGGASFGVRMKF